LDHNFGEDWFNDTCIHCKKEDGFEKKNESITIFGGRQL
jgi:hypothetical protein